MTNIEAAAGMLCEMGDTEAIPTAFMAAEDYQGREQYRVFINDMRRHASEKLSKARQDEYNYSGLLMILDAEKKRLDLERKVDG